MPCSRMMTAAAAVVRTTVQSGERQQRAASEFEAVAYAAAPVNCREACSSLWTCTVL